VPFGINSQAALILGRSLAQPKVSVRHITKKNSFLNMGVCAYVQAKIEKKSGGSEGLKEI
jgi:hypothetical protein